MVTNNIRPLAFDLRARAYVLGISYERAKFLVACPHRQNAFFRKDHQVEVIPFNLQVQIDEAKRLGIGAYDAAKMFNLEAKELIAQGFKYRTRFPKPPGNGTYSLFQHEDHQDVTRYLKAQNKYKTTKPTKKKST